MTELNKQQFLAFMMATIPVKEGVELQLIRERFMKRDRPWNEAGALAEYRYQQVTAIFNRCKRSEA